MNNKSFMDILFFNSAEFTRIFSPINFTTDKKKKYYRKRKKLNFYYVKN